ncbi:serine/threonine protein kinase [Candidatus Magnetobacterium bavaricum]|uniref:non-specific serine/threonine protein kinase n=1 Tax=Candidatus Magnetobacterium bavaricum TaxID=29290 RepID=A0A0F3GR97_9BACT|nr:serine/threonine protein kinase [Candidatus Magnetobacterium bavaricum]
MAYGNLCYGCFSEKNHEGACPVCGYEDIKKHSPIIIKPGTALYKDKYIVGRVLGKPGGFGITYIRWDRVLVAIKEFIPGDCAGRDANTLTVMPHSHEDKEAFEYGLKKFLAEARTLARFDHANIVRINGFFEENHTGYIVMDYCDGINLEEYLKRKGGRITEKSAISIMMPILDGLREVHANDFLHRDIKPLNIFITRNKIPVLLDFGAARIAMREKSRSLTVVLTPGFAPYEQYQTHGNQGPWTDVYACGATMYYMISGQVPPDAIDRKNGTSKIGQLMRLVPGVSQKVNDAIMLALSLDPSNRPSTVRDFQKLLASNNESPPRRIIDEDKAPPLRNNRYARNKNHQEIPSAALAQRREKPVPTVENADNTADSTQKIKHIETAVFLSLLFPGIGHFYLELYYMATILVSIALASPSLIYQEGGRFFIISNGGVVLVDFRCNFNPYKPFQ